MTILGVLFSYINGFHSGVVDKIKAIKGLRECMRDAKDIVDSVYTAYLSANGTAISDLAYAESNFDDASLRDDVRSFLSANGFSKQWTRKEVVK